MHQKKPPLIRQLDAVIHKPEFIAYQRAFQPWFTRDMRQHPELYQPIIDELAKTYPIVPMMYLYFKQLKPLPFLPEPRIFDAMIDGLYEVAKKRQPPHIIALERRAAGVIPNARRN